MTARRIIASLVALLLAVQIARIAFVERVAEAAPALAAQVWPTHPDVELSGGMVAIADAMRERRSVPPQTVQRILEVSRKAPLAHEPFMVRGVQAQTAGDMEAAEQAFVAAERRNPRSLPARYFLADLYLRQGDAQNGLRELGALSRLTPGGATHLAPHVAVFARNRANWPYVRALFRSDAALANATLKALASDPRNADIVVALSGNQPREAQHTWLPDLLVNLIKAEQFAKARAVWASASDVRNEQGMLLYDPEFRLADAPPPFNWSLSSSGVGLAERLKGGGLNVLFYGQQDGVLASQLLVLPPGRYRLSVSARGAPAGAETLHWILVCATSQAAISTASLRSVIATPWVFSVPANCPAQRLELSARASELPQQRVDLTITAVRLEREQAGG